MPDPRVSGQNFLRLLFGGAEKGIQGRQRAQEQQADLGLRLQQMRQQRGQFDESLAQRRDLAVAAREQQQGQFEARDLLSRKQHEDRLNIERARRNQVFNESVFRSGLDLKKFGLEKSKVSALNKLTEAKAMAQGASTNIAQQRLALTTRFKEESRNPENYSFFTKDEFEEIPPPLRQDFEKVKDPITGATRFKVLKPGARGRIRKMQSALDEIAGVEQHLLAQQPQNTFGPVDDATEAEDIINDLLGLTGE